MCKPDIVYIWDAGEESLAKRKKMLWARIREDFLFDRVENLEEWILWRTEVRLCSSAVAHLRERGSQMSIPQAKRPAIKPVELENMANSVCEMFFRTIRIFFDKGRSGEGSPVISGIRNPKGALSLFSEYKGGTASPSYRTRCSFNASSLPGNAFERFWVS